MPRVIRIGKDGASYAPTLPADAVTRTFGIFGVKDSGKTTTGRVIAEGICKLGGHVCVLDPVGVWWGMTRAGEGPGVPGIVIGGEHADVPLEETGGHLVAEVVLARQYPVVVIDLKLLRKGAAQRFMADFLEEVYFRNRRPLHLIFEEADRALPQNPRGMDPTLGRVLGAAEDIVKLGRSRGLGSMFLSQRMATVTKNVTEQVEALVLHAQVGPRDRKAVKEWVEVNGNPARTEEAMNSMASLDVGEAWLLSPKWLKLLERIKVRMPKTLDSSATPTDDEREVEEHAPRAPVDLDELRRLMAETVQRAEANDPRKLRARIEELEGELAEAMEREPETVAAEPERILVPDRDAAAKLVEVVAALDAFEGGTERHIDELRTLAEEMAQGLAAALAPVAEHVRQIEAVLQVVSDTPASGRSLMRPSPAPDRPARSAPATAAPPAPARESNGDLSAGAAKLLEELNGLHPLRLTRTQLATILRRGARSSTLTQQLAELTASGYVVNAGGKYSSAAAGSNGSMTAQGLREKWRSALPDGPRALLDVLMQHPDGLTRAELFATAGFSPTSSTPVTHLKLLTDNDLAVKIAGGVALGPAIDPL